MSQLLDIQPSRELKFLFEVKKQSICNVQLINRTDQHVAFKVKTTSPKKYCVRPNVGVVLPNESCEFAVIMQAQRSPPSDTNCKDKFLVQSTIVPDGTMENDVTSDMFSKDDGKYVEERKLKVVILSPPHSPELSPMNGKVKQVPLVEDSVVADEFSSGRERHSSHDMHLDEEDATELHIENKEVEKPKAYASSEADTEVEVELIKATEPMIKRDMEFQPIEVLESNTVEEAKPAITEDLEVPIELVEPNTEYNLEENPVFMKDMESQPIEIMESNAVEILEETPVITRNVEYQPIKTVESKPVEKLESKPMTRKDVQTRSTEVMESNMVEKVEAKPLRGIEPIMVKETDGLRFAKPMTQTQSTEVMESNRMEKVEAKPVRGIEPIMVKETDVFRLAREVEEMKSKLLQLEFKLSKAEKTIVKLTEDSRLSFRERQLQEKQLALLKDQRIQKTSFQEEIPLLSVCMVAMLSIVIGYLLHR